MDLLKSEKRPSTVTPEIEDKRQMATYSQLLRSVAWNHETIFKEWTGPIGYDIGVMFGDIDKTNEEWIKILVGHKNPDEEHCRMALECIITGPDELVTESAKEMIIKEMKVIKDSNARIDAALAEVTTPALFSADAAEQARKAWIAAGGK